MSDSSNVYSLPGAVTAHISRANKTEANLRTDLKECQFAVETDTKKAAFADDAKGYHTIVCEDVNGKVAIGNGTTAARSELDLYGAMYQTKIITAAEQGIRKAVGLRVAYSGSNATAGYVPVCFEDDITMPTGCKLLIVPKYTGLANAGIGGMLSIIANQNIEAGDNHGNYRGMFSIFWFKQLSTEATQNIEKIFNYNDNIGLYEGATGFDLKANAFAAGDCASIALINTTSYPVQVWYKFEGSFQVAL
jgi:hypothetical protein